MNLEYFRRRAGLLIEGLRERFKELASRDFPASAPTEILQILVWLLNILQSKFSSADERTIKLIIKVLCEYQKLLIIFDNAHSEQTPRGLVRFLEDLLITHQINEGPCKLIAAPQARYNYSILDLAPIILKPISNFVAPEEFEQLRERLGGQVFLIAFPRMERDNTLLHAVFGHEVGHLIAAKFLKEVTSQPRFAVELNAALKPVLEMIKAQYQDPIELVAELQKQEVMLRNYWQRGLIELISDYIGYLLFGPSALFASYAVFSLSDLDMAPKPDSYYPPGRYRLRFALETMKEENFTSTLEKLSRDGSNLRINAFPSVIGWLSDLEKLVSEPTDKVNLENSVVCKAAYDWITSSLPEAKRFAKSRITAVIYSAGRMEAEVPELIDRLSLDLPPAEIGTWEHLKAVDWPSAFLAAWCYLINGRKLTQEELQP